MLSLFPNEKNVGLLLRDFWVGQEGVLQAAGEVEAGAGEVWQWGGHVEPRRPAPAPLTKPAHPGQ